MQSPCVTASTGRPVKSGDVSWAADALDNYNYTLARAQNRLMSLPSTRLLNQCIGTRSMLLYESCFER